MKRGELIGETDTSYPFTQYPPQQGGYGGPPPQQGYYGQPPMQQQNMSGLQAKQASAREKHGCCGPCVACCLGACACCCLEDIMCAGKHSQQSDKNVQSADLFRFALFLLQQNVSIAFSKRCTKFSITFVFI